jgi:hypothetical protein
LKFLNRSNIDIEKQKIGIEGGQLRITLGGSLDLAGLTGDLRRKGYFVANDPSDLDSQGWGTEEDLEGYYPYWVFRDDESWVFAFTPEGFQAEQDKNNHLIFEKQTQDQINHWTTYLEEWCT